MIKWIRPEGKKGLNLICILKVELTGYFDGLMIFDGLYLLISVCMSYD